MKLLLDDYPLIIIPSLAKEVGLNEAIVLQQLHYWLEKSKNVEEGYKWVYNTYKDWTDQFPFWSESTLRRTITKLENEGYIITGNYNKVKIDKTKWYRIDYNKLNKHMNSPCVQNEQSTGQNEQSKESNWTDEEVNLNTPITRDYTETISETTTDIFNHWNSKKIIVHRKMNKAMESHINGRLEDYSPQELKDTIDNYEKILNNDEYWYTYKFTLEDFMKPNKMIKFHSESDPFSNYSKGGQPNGQSGGSFKRNSKESRDYEEERNRERPSFIKSV